MAGPGFFLFAELFLFFSGGFVNSNNSFSPNIFRGRRRSGAKNPRARVRVPLDIKIFG